MVGERGGVCEGGARGDAQLVVLQHAFIRCGPRESLHLHCSRCLLCSHKHMFAQTHVHTNTCSHKHMFAKTRQVP